MKKRVRIYKLGLLILVVVIGVAVWYALGDRLSLDRVVVHEQSLREWVEQRPLTALIVALAIFTVTSLVPGTPGKTFVYGWLFGFWQGLLAVNFGLAAAACLTFLFVRFFLRDAVQSRMGYFVHRVDGALARNGSTYLLTLRLMFAPFTLLNYTLGATHVRLRTFWWTTQLGVLPANAVFVFAGSRLPSLREIVDQGPMSLLSPDLVIVLIILSLLSFLARRIVVAIWPQFRDRATGRANAIGRV